MVGAEPDQPAGTEDFLARRCGKTGQPALSGQEICGIFEGERLLAPGDVEQPVVQNAAVLELQVQVLTVAAEQADLEGDMQRFLARLPRCRRQDLIDGQLRAMSRAQI